MIISHRHRFIFLAVPRTGSQSIRAALRPFLGPEDEEQAVWRTDRRLRNAELAAIGHGHIDAGRAMLHLGRELWRSYFTFAFVRDPWERFLSAASLRLGARAIFQQRPVECLKLLVRSDSLMGGMHFRPQVEFLRGDDGEMAVDFVGRLETLSTDFARVARRVGLERATMGHEHASPAADRSAWRDGALVTTVARRYAADYAAFGYPLPPGA